MTITYATGGSTQLDAEAVAFKNDSEIASIYIWIDDGTIDGDAISNWTFSTEDALPYSLSGTNYTIDEADVNAASPYGGGTLNGVGQMADLLATEDITGTFDATQGTWSLAYSATLSSGDAILLELQGSMQ